MTAPAQQDIDPFAGGDKAPALSWKDKPVGTVYEGKVTDSAKLVQSRDFETGEPATWPDGNPKMAAVVNLEVNGEARSLWASKPSAMFAALAEAQRKAGKPFEAGGTLAVRYVRDEPNKNPRLNAQKIYEARYTPPPAPDVFASTTGDDSAPPW